MSFSLFLKLAFLGVWTFKVFLWGGSSATSQEVWKYYPEYQNKLWQAQEVQDPSSPLQPPKFRHGQGWKNKS